MSADTLTDAGAEVLRVLSSGPSTYERISRLASRRPIGTLAVLTRQKLATHDGGQDSYARWAITPAGREALARHEANAVNAANDAANDDEGSCGDVRE